MRPVSEVRQVAIDYLLASAERENWPYVDPMRVACPTVPCCFGPGPEEWHLFARFADTTQISAVRRQLDTSPALFGTPPEEAA